MEVRLTRWFIVNASTLCPVKSTADVSLVPVYMTAPRLRAPRYNETLKVSYIGIALTHIAVRVAYTRLAMT